MRVGGPFDTVLEAPAGIAWQSGAGQDKAIVSLFRGAREGKP